MSFNDEIEITESSSAERDGGASWIFTLRVFKPIVDYYERKEMMLSMYADA